MNYLKVVGSFCISLMVAGVTIVVPSSASADRVELPVKLVAQQYVVPADAKVVALDRDSYSASTPEEVEAKRAEREAAEKAAAEEAARQQAEEAAKKKTYTPPQHVVANPGSAQAIAHDMVISRGWSEDDFACLVALWNRESGWNVNAHNSSSGAHGIPQALPGNKMASAGSDWETNPATQITWGLNYIGGRYGNPCGAWEHSENNNWY